MSVVLNVTNSMCDSKQIKKLIMNELQKRKCRITAQRDLIVDIILENQCACCKEIYYQAVERDSSIGIATVYRMLALLEDIGLIDRKNMYQIQSKQLVPSEKTECESQQQIVFLHENNQVELLDANWYNAIKAHLKSKGMIQDEEISIVIKSKKTCKKELD